MRVVAQVHERINYPWPNLLGFVDGVTEKKNNEKEKEVIYLNKRYRKWNIEIKNKKVLKAKVRLIP